MLSLLRKGGGKVETLGKGRRGGGGETFHYAAQRREGQGKVGLIG